MAAFVLGLLFGLALPGADPALAAGVKRGQVFNDLNHDGVKDPGEPGVNGWEIHVFGTEAGTGIPVHEHFITQNLPGFGDGFYTFTLNPGTYTVCEGLQPDWTQTTPLAVPPPFFETLANCTTHSHGGTISPGPRGYNFTILGVTHEGNDFGNFQTVSTRGQVFNDLNHDGVKDPGEPGVNGWEIHVFGTETGTGTPVHEHFITQNLPGFGDGFYTFTLNPGTYTVCEGLQPDWTQTAPLAVPPPVEETLANCTVHTHGGIISPGPRGYNFTIVGVETREGNDFSNFQTTVSTEVPLTDFRDVRRPDNISIGTDVGGTGHQALNFTGSAGAGGDTWITVYDPTPNPPPVTFGSVSLTADVLIHTFNNKKGAGLLALYNEALGKKGLALTLYDAGNTDTLVLATVDQAGKLVALKTVSLGAAIAENVWYRVSMDVTVESGVVSVFGTVFKHDDPTDPNSALTTPVGVPLTFSATLGTGALGGVDPTGEVGILAAAVSTANSSSVTNITVDP